MTSVFLKKEKILLFRVPVNWIDLSSFFTVIISAGGKEPAKKRQRGNNFNYATYKAMMNSRYKIN